MEIRIAHLYPELLNLYGDKGNIASLVYRCEKRGISCTVRQYEPHEEIDLGTADIVILGGGGDKEQTAVSEMLIPFKDKIKAYIENGGSFLALCGGFELVGDFYKIGDTEYKALGILDGMYTVRDEERHIGNIVIDSDVISDKLVGFENHSGRIFADKYDNLGRVVSGYGNNGSGTEGVIYKNLIGTYIHGPLLPKNPKLSDYIINNALRHKYGEVSLAPLDDELETRAHDYAVARFSQRR